jgi:hypothetical protein
VIDHRREPRWIFARFHLNDAKALAEAMPVQTALSHLTRKGYRAAPCQLAN